MNTIPLLYSLLLLFSLPSYAQNWHEPSNDFIGILRTAPGLSKDCSQLIQKSIPAVLDLKVIIKNYYKTYRYTYMHGPSGLENCERLINNLQIVQENDRPQPKNLIISTHQNPQLQFLSTQLLEEAKDSWRVALVSDRFNLSHTPMAQQIDQFVYSVFGEWIFPQLHTNKSHEFFNKPADSELTSVLSFEKISMIGGYCNACLLETVNSIIKQAILNKAPQLKISLLKKYIYIGKRALSLKEYIEFSKTDSNKKNLYSNSHFFDKLYKEKIPSDKEIEDCADLLTRPANYSDFVVNTFQYLFTPGSKTQITKIHNGAIFVVKPGITIQIFVE